MRNLTDEQKRKAEQAVEDYRKKLDASVRELIKHRFPCGEGQDLTIVGRQLESNQEEIEFPPGGTSSSLVNGTDGIIIPTDDGKPNKPNNRNSR